MVLHPSGTGCSAASRTDRYLAVGFASRPGCASFSSDHHQPEGSSLLDAGQAIRVIAPLPSIATTALSAQPIVSRGQLLHGENYAPRILRGNSCRGHLARWLASKRSTRRYRRAFSPGRVSTFLERCSRARYWTVSLRIWLGLVA